MLRPIAEQNGPVNADSLTIPPLPYLSTRATNTRCVHHNHLSISPVKQPTTTAVASSPHEEQERINIRLASAFVMYFVLGWGDGGKFRVVFEA